MAIKWKESSDPIVHVVYAGRYAYRGLSTTMIEVEHASLRRAVLTAAHLQRKLEAEGWTRK